MTEMPNTAPLPAAPPPLPAPIADTQQEGWINPIPQLQHDFTAMTQLGDPRKRPPTDALAILSLVFSVLWIFWLGSIAAFVMGMISVKRRDHAGQPRSAVAMVGLFLSGAELLFLLAGVVLFLVAHYTHPG